MRQVLVFLRSWSPLILSLTFLFLLSHFYLFQYSNFELKPAPECGFVTARMLGFLGSQMYIYSAVYGMAKANRKKAILPLEGSELLRGAFESLSVQFYNQSREGGKFKWRQLSPHGYSIFTDELMRLRCDENVSVTGYEPHSWKYFSSHFDELRKEFKFKKNVLRTCLKDIRKIFKSDCLLIGVHLRRGDFVQADKQSFGHVPAREDLFSRGVTYFTTRFKSNCLQFVVLGNDRKFNEEVSKNISNVHVFSMRDSALDLCILSHCNHSIISTGTFGWMSTFLANGITLYQKEQTRNGSTLAGLTKLDDFILPHWIPI